MKYVECVYARNVSELMQPFQSARKRERMEIAGMCCSKCKSREAILICVRDVYLHPLHGVKTSGRNYQDLPTCQTTIGLFPPLSPSSKFSGQDGH